MILQNILKYSGSVSGGMRLLWAVLVDGYVVHEYTRMTDGAYMVILKNGNLTRSVLLIES